MLFAVSHIKIALSVSFREIRWILGLYKVDKFSQFSFCNIFFSKVLFFHLKVLIVAKLYSSIELIEKIFYRDLQNIFFTLFSIQAKFSY